MQNIGWTLQDFDNERFTNDESDRRKDVVQYNYLERLMNLWGDMKVDQWEVCMNAAQEIVLSSSNGILHDQVDQWHNKGYFIVKNVNLPGEVN